MLSERFFGEWHALEGNVEILSLPEAMEPLVDYYRRVSGEHPDWQDYREAMARERRVLLRITVDRSGPTTQGIDSAQAPPLARPEAAEAGQHLAGVQLEKSTLIRARGVEDQMGESEVEVRTDAFHVLVGI